MFTKISVNRGSRGEGRLSGCNKNVLLDALVLFIARQSLSVRVVAENDNEYYSD